MLSNLESLPPELMQQLILLLFPSNNKLHEIGAYKDLFSFARIAKSFYQQTMENQNWKIILKRLIENNFILTKEINYSIWYEESPLELLKIIVLNFHLINKFFRSNNSTQEKNVLKKMLAELTKKLTDYPDQPILLTLMCNLCYLLNDYTNVFVYGIKAKQQGILNSMILQFTCITDPQVSLINQSDCKVVYKCIKKPVIEKFLKPLDPDLIFNEYNYRRQITKDYMKFFEEFRKRNQRANLLEITLFDHMMYRIDEKEIGFASSIQYMRDNPKIMS